MGNEIIDIQDRCVTFETAQLLKANDFHVKFCPGVYDNTGKLRFFYRRKDYDHNINQFKFSAPTQSQAMAWLRIVHGLFTAFYNDDLDYCWCVLDVNDRDENHDPKQVTESFAGYFQLEDAAEDAIKYCLKNLIHGGKRILPPMTDEEIVADLKKMVPKTMLTEEQFKAFKDLGPNLQAVKYVNTVTGEGLKIAKTYFDLYKNENYDN